MGNGSCCYHEHTIRCGHGPHSHPMPCGTDPRESPHEFVAEPPPNSVAALRASLAEEQAAREKAEREHAEFFERVKNESFEIGTTLERGKGDNLESLHDAACRVVSEKEQLTARLAEAEGALPLARLGEWVLQQYLESCGDIDGGELFDYLVESGLFRQRSEKHAPEECERCDEFDEPCYEVTVPDAIRRALLAAPAQGVKE